MAVELKYFTLLAVGLTYFLAVLWLDPQATADSRIHRQIFVRQKSTEKIRVAEFTGEVFLQKFRRKKYRYSNRVSTTLENMEISGNLLILENSGKTQGI